MAERDDDVKLVSAVQEVSASDGTTFDILGQVSKDVAKLRGDALVGMREIAQAREPELLYHLTTGSGVSSEYAKASGISHSENPEVKADLVRVAVNEALAEGHRWSAVHTLAYAEAANLALPEYDEQFVVSLYEAALAEGELGDAWMIAGEMTRDAGKIVKPDASTPEAETQAQVAWEERERRTFTQCTEAVLTREEELKGERDWELKLLFNEMRFRKDGFQSEKPNELCQRLAQAKIDSELRRDRGWVALIDASEANMPADYIAQLRKQVNPTAIDRAQKWWNRVSANVGRMLAPKA